MLGAKISKNMMSSLQFVNVFVGIDETVSALQRLIDTVYNYSKC